MILLATLLAVGIGFEVPNVADWKVVSARAIEVRPDDFSTVFLGMVTEYQNPENAMDRVQLFTRHVAIISARSEGLDMGVNPFSMLTREAESQYHQTEEEAALARVRAASDVFAVVRWRADESGRFVYWLYDQSGARTAMSVGPGAMTQTPLSEPSLLKKHERVIVGLVFTLGYRTNVLQMDQAVFALVSRELKRKKGEVRAQ